MLSFENFTRLAEFIATVGVIVTMIYVVIEVRETTRIYTANAHTDIGTAAAEFLASIYSDRELFMIWSTGLSDTSALNEEEQGRFSMVLIAYWTLLANGYYMARVDPTITNRIEGMLDIMIMRPSVRAWWQRGAYMPSPDFREYVESRIVHLKSTGLISEDQ